MGSATISRGEMTYSYGGNRPREDSFEAFRERRIKIQAHHQIHHNGFKFSDVKKLNTSQERDSDLEDIQQQIDRIEESEYNSERKKYTDSEGKEVKYLEYKTATISKGDDQHSGLNSENISNLEKQERQLKGTNLDHIESIDKALNQVYVQSDSKRQDQNINSDYRTPSKRTVPRETPDMFESDKVLSQMLGGYRLPVHPEFESPSRRIHNQDMINSMNEYERVIMTANLKVLPVNGERVSHLIQKSPTKLSSKKLQSSAKKHKISGQKKTPSRMTSYYEGLALQLEDHPGYGLINSRFAYNKNSYSDEKQKQRLRLAGRKNVGPDDPSSYAYYVKDSVIPEYSEVFTSRNEDQWPSMKSKSKSQRKHHHHHHHSKKHKIKSSKKNNTRIASVDKTQNNSKSYIEIDFNYDSEYSNTLNKSFESQETVKHKS